MNNPTIFGKDINTNAIIPLPVLGNVLLTTNGGLDNLNDVVITSATTGDLLKYNGSGWVNAQPTTTQKDYIIMNMYGTTTSSLTNPNSLKQIMRTNAGYWSGTQPNPATATQGSMSSRITPFSSVFDTNTGFITIDSSKNYIVSATINQGGVNLNASNQVELAIYNASSGSAVAFSPNYLNVGRIDIDFAGLGVNVLGYVSGASKIVIMFRYVIAQNIAVNALDTSLSVSVIEI